MTRREPLPPNSRSAFRVYFPGVGNNCVTIGRVDFPTSVLDRRHRQIMHTFSLRQTLGLGAILVLACVANLSGKTYTVQVGATGNNFSPSYLTIEAGDKVQWVWESSFHSTTSGTPKNPDGRWNSGVLNSGSSFTYEFEYPGTYPYYCSVHSACCNMLGTINVVASSPSPTPSPSPSASPSPSPHPHLQLRPRPHRRLRRVRRLRQVQVGAHRPRRSRGLARVQCGLL